MRRTYIKVFPVYFDKYINLVRDIDFFEAFENSLKDIEALDLMAIERIGVKTSQPDKWTIKEILQHITDIERLLTTGTLRFARNGNDFVIALTKMKLPENQRRMIELLNKF